jgi:rhodanese-related sulfurtransferase
MSQEKEGQAASQKDESPQDNQQSSQSMAATRVTVDEVKERMDRGEPFAFVDTRNPGAWDEADTKLPGAIRVPADEVEQHLTEIPRDRAVITYCT